MKRSLATLALALATSTALAADNAVIVTPGSGVTMRTQDVGGLVQSPIVQLGNNAGTNIVGAGTTVPVSGTVTATGTVAATQSGTWNIGTVTAITGPVPVTESGTWTIRNTGNAGAIFDGVIGAATAPANMIVGGGVFNSSPITLTNGQSSALQFDANGFLKVNTAAGAAAGGTSSNFGSAFPTPGTAIGMSDGTNMVAFRSTAYGTTPTGLNAVAVNAFVTNAAPAGRTANGLSAALASPVVQPSAPNSGATAFPIFSTAATTVGVSIKTSAAVVFACQLANTSTTLAFVKIYNKASAATVGTDIPVKTLIVPGPAAGGGGSNIVFGPGGFALTTGFSIGITGLAVNSDTTAVPANNVVVNCDYE